MRKLDNKLTKTIGDDVSDNLQEETYIGLKQKLIKEYQKKTSEELEDEQLFLQYQIQRLNDTKLIYDGINAGVNNFLSFIAIMLSIVSLFQSFGVTIIPEGFANLIILIISCAVGILVVTIIPFKFKQSDEENKNTKRFLYELKLDCIKEILNEKQKQDNRAQHKRRHKHKVRLKLKSKQK